MKKNSMALFVLALAFAFVACRMEAVIEEVSPGEIISGEPAMLEIQGRGFQEGSRVWLGDVECPRVVFAGSRKLVVEVPAELEPGVWSVRVESPKGKPARLDSGIRVNPPPPAPTPVEFAPELGLIHSLREEGQERGISQTNFNEQSLAAADLNNNGIMDLVFAGSRGVWIYLGGEDGQFKEFTEEAGMAGVAAYAVYLADYDNDGLVDMLITGRRVRLFRNLGDARFEEVTEQVGIEEGYFISAVWCDFDRDGWLDLFLGAPLGDDRLYQNRGGKFERFEAEFLDKMTMARELGIEQPTTFSAACADYDRDGYPDLFVGVRGLPSRLLHNEQGRGFKDVLEETGINLHIGGSEERPIFALDLGVTWGDYNNDGFFDLFTTSGPGGIHLYQNQQGKRFSDVTRKSRLRATASPACAAWGDFNNNGLLDLAISDNLTGIQVYANRGDGTFVDVSLEIGIEETQRSSPLGIFWMDINQNGALDLVAVNYNEPNSLFMNTPYPGRRYLKFQLRGTASNSDAIGAVVELECGDTTMTRQVSAGEGHLSQPPPLVHFGLGSCAQADRVRITWPSGQIQTLEQVPADQMLVITEPGEKKPPAPGKTPPEQPDDKPAPGGDSP